MSTATVITGGYGSFGTASLVITDGYSVGSFVPPTPSVPGAGGGGGHREYEEGTRKRKRKVAIPSAQAEAESLRAQFEGLYSDKKPEAAKPLGAKSKRKASAKSKLSPAEAIKEAARNKELLLVSEQLALAEKARIEALMEEERIILLLLNQ